MGSSRFAPLPAIVATLMIAAATHAAGGQSAPSQAKARSALEGAYADSQAQRGENTFRTTCAACHAVSTLTGAPFERRWGGRSAYDLFDLISTTMPFEDPGGMSRQEYVEIVAYLLKLNGYPASASTPLPAERDQLRLVRIDPRPASSPP
ncbi:MAG TPA: c-type cytochrome [Gemmatimonadaceae bacterium]|nr:c-type cytochrome [Gemmatimonadaceae bacterium]